MKKTNFVFFTIIFITMLLLIISSNAKSNEYDDNRSLSGSTYNDVFYTPTYRYYNPVSFVFFFNFFKKNYLIIQFFFSMEKKFMIKEHQIRLI